MEEIHKLTQEIQTLVQRTEEVEVVMKKPVETPRQSPEKSKVDLRIVESQENIPETVKSLTITENVPKASSSDPYTNVVIEMEKYDIRYVALKDEKNASQEPSTSEERRQLESQRSVKEIIDSINKSQSLLKINHEEARQKNGRSSESISTKIKELETQEKNINSMLDEIEFETRVNDLRITEDVSEAELNEIPVVVRDLQTHISREEEVGSLFEKCSSPNKRSSAGHEWNPLPKPRRTQLPGSDS